MDPQVAQAAAILQAGGVVAFPTETVYGLGAAALNPQAVARVFEIKGRPRFDPLIVHVAEAQAAFELWQTVPTEARQLAEHFWPGPLTIVLPKKELIPDIVTAGLDTVAVRIPAHPLALELLRTFGGPVAAPSANRFGGVSPTTAEHVRQDLGQAVDLILDGGACTVGVESTVIGLVGGRAVLLRPGATPVEEIEAVIGPVEQMVGSHGRILSPGQMPRHYAPRTRLVVVDREELTEKPPEKWPGLRVGLLAFSGPLHRPGFKAVEVLSPQGDLRQAAANLFAALRRLDAMGLDLILAERVPERGLGLAINDRLERAAGLGAK